MVLAIQVLSISGAMYDISMPGLQGAREGGRGREAGKKMDDQNHLCYLCIGGSMYV